MTAALGIIHGESIADYHASDSTSHSKLEVLRDRDRGTLKYYRRFVARTAAQAEHKDHFDVGNGIDALLLEGDSSFANKTWVAPDGFRWNTTEGRALVAAQRKAGKIVLSAEESVLVHNLRIACHANPDLNALLSEGRSQVTLRHRLDDFTVQVRPDWLNESRITLPSREGSVGPYMVDLKSAEDLTRFYKMLPSYYRAAALYREVYREVIAATTGTPIGDIAAPAWFWAVVFKSEPICSVIYEPDPGRLAEATTEIVGDLGLLKKCYATDNWSASTQGVQQLQGFRKSP